MLVDDNVVTSPLRRDSPASIVNGSDGERNYARDVGRMAARSTHESTPPTSETRSSSASPSGPRDSHLDGLPTRLDFGAEQDAVAFPLSPRDSLRSSVVTRPTTFIPSQRDRLRYSWQSIADDDEGTKPRIHVIKIVSTAFTASAGIGQEEAFGFSISTGGRRIAVYNSARLFILQTAALPVDVSQEFALKRKPLDVEVLDEASILAVLADEHTINVYDFSHQTCRRTKTIRLDHPASTIALHRTGALVAAAYEGGVEVFSLASSAMPTHRRAFRCSRMDKLTFSDDGSTLLGTTTRLHASSTVIVSVPVFPAAANGIPSHEELKEAWCEGLLEPENIRNSSHATFWRERGNPCNEDVFAWNGLEDTFGIMHTPDLEYSNLACPIGVSEPLAAVGGLGAAIHSVPSVDESGHAVAMIVNHRTVRIYTIPQDVPEDELKVEAHSLDHELTDEYGCPFSDIRWVHSHKSIAPSIASEAVVRGRLIVTSPGGVIDPMLGPHSYQDVEGGRIIIFDFDSQYSGQPGQIFTFTLGKAPPQALEEETLDVATEVALVRKRTVTQRSSGTLSQRPPSLGRSATTATRWRSDSRQMQIDGSSSQEQSSSIQTTPTQDTAPMRLSSRSRGGQYAGRSLLALTSEATRSLPDLVETSEGAYEQPYTQSAPRSTGAMQRAATNSNRHRFQAIEEHNEQRTNPEGLPLPAYSEVPNQTLPAKFRILAGLDIPNRVLTDSDVESAPVATAASSAFPTSANSESTFAPPTSDGPNMQSQRSTDSAHHSVSPIGIGPPPPLIGDWENVSPLPAQMRANRDLRHQTSWETMTTEQLNAMSPPSQHVLSPVVPLSHTLADEQPRPSFESLSASSLPTANTAMLQQRPLARFTPDGSRSPSILQSTATSQDNVPNHLGMEFQHAALRPFGQTPSTSPAQEHSASMSALQSRPVTRDNDKAIGHSGMYDRSPSDRQTPFQRVNEAAAAARRAQNGKAAVTDSAVIGGGASNPILHWTPPCSPVPPASSSGSATNPGLLPRRGGSNRTAWTTSSDQHSVISEEGEVSSTAAAKPLDTLRTSSAPLLSSADPRSRGNLSSSGSGVSSIAASDSKVYDFAFRDGTTIRAASRSGAMSRASARSGGSGRPTSAAGDGVMSPRKSPTKSDLETLLARERADVRGEFRDVEAQAKKCIVM